jgi:hypothetical protein
MRILTTALLLIIGACRKDSQTEVGLADTSQPVTENPSADTTEKKPENAVDRAAVTELERMGAYLRSLKAVQVKAVTTRDEVLEDGQKVQFASTADLLMRKPDRLRGELTSDAQHRLFFYDGKTFTLWADLPGYYATVPAPATIAELDERLQQKFAIELRLRDLFYWGTDRSNIKDITAATDIGPSQVEGTTVEHFAFRQTDVDWQIWIQKGDYPLPRKLVITTLTDEARPDYTAILTWNLAPSFNDDAFVFDPPAGAHKIILAEADTLSVPVQP